MLKKSAILGLVLLVIGGAVLAWVVLDRRSERQRAASFKLKYNSEPDEYLKRYNEWLNMSPEERANTPLHVNGSGHAKTKSQIREEQGERLNADLDMLAMEELDTHPLVADVLYGENWQAKVRKYKKSKETSEFILTGSVVCASIGGATFGLCFVFWVIRLVVGGASWLKGADVGVGEVELEETDKIAAADVNESSEASFVNSARVTIGERCIDADATEASDDSEGSGRGKIRKTIAVLISGKKPTEYEKSPEQKISGGVGDMARSSGAGKVSQTILVQQQKDASMLEESLKAHTLKLEKQMDEFKRMQNARQSAAEQSKPLNGALEELTEQVSAIRDYAAHQQQRVEKLQDGYDWNIVRSFCLRVIRCIDNLEGRIERLSTTDIGTEHLEEVRDELIFALESSGVEQFRPEVNSAYRGQEKSTEAVKEREHCEDSGKFGMIAKVVRPGYQYFIDEGNLKVVRAAQVKLFGQVQ